MNDKKLELIRLALEEWHDEKLKELTTLIINGAKFNNYEKDW